MAREMSSSFDVRAAYRRCRRFAVVRYWSIGPGRPRSNPAISIPAMFSRNSNRVISICRNSVDFKNLVVVAKVEWCGEENVETYPFGKKHILTALPQFIASHRQNVEVLRCG